MWSNELYSLFKHMRKLEKNKTSGPQLTNNIRAVVKYFINKDLRAYMNQEGVGLNKKSNYSSITVSQYSNTPSRQIF